MDNLNPIAVRQHRRLPEVPAHDFLIQLDRNAFRRERKFANQLAQVQFVGNFPRFTVDVNSQCLPSNSSRRQDHAAQFGRLSIGLGAQ